MGGHAVRARDIEEVLREGGFTPFHRRIVLVTGVAWTFVAMEILLIGFTLPLFRALWDLSGAWLGILGSSALAGSLVGSVLWGAWPTGWAAVMAEITEDRPLERFEMRRRPWVGFVQKQRHRRDQTRNLPRAIRNAALRLAGRRIFRGNCTPLLDEP